MKRATTFLLTGAVAATLSMTLGCVAPDEQRPGLWLSGDVASPGDWSFTDSQRLIAIQVHTPYLVPHSVTIWCATVDGQLYVGAREPETKSWPAWAEQNPDVRLGINAQLYDVRLERIEDEALLTRIRTAYATKYDLPDPPEAGSPPVRYWLAAAKS